MLQIGRVGRHIRCRMKREHRNHCGWARLCNSNCSNPLAAQGLGFQGFVVGRGCLDQSGELQRRHINPLPGTHCPQGLRQQLTCFVPGEKTPQQRLHKQAGPMTGRACCTRALISKQRPLAAHEPGATNTKCASRQAP